MACKCSRGERLRKFDMFGAPIGVTYGGESTYQTAIGGCATIALIVFFGVNIFMSCLGLLIAPYFTRMSTESLKRYSLNSSIEELSTQAQTLAAGVQSISDLPDGYTVDDFMRVQFFYALQRTTGTDGKVQESVKWVNSIKCKEFYSDTEDSQVALEFDDDMWVCPDVTSIQLQNDPKVFKLGNGINFNMVLQTCEDAQATSALHSLKTYNDNFNCYSGDDKEKYLQLMVGNSKIMTQMETDPIEFRHGTASEAFFANRISVDIVERAQGQKYRTLAAKQSVSYRTESQKLWWLPFGNIFATLLQIEETPDLITYNFAKAQTLTISPRTIEEFGSAYLMVSIGEDEKYSTVIYKLASIMDLLAYFGSSAVSAIAILTIFMSDYSNFKYHLSALKSLYFDGSKKDNDSHDFGDGWSEELLNTSLFEFNQHYLAHRAFLVLSSPLFCCIRSCWQESWEWYKQQELLEKRIEIALQNFHSEVDLKHILRIQRISDFLQRTDLNKRQRHSVRYFRKQIVKNETIRNLERIRQMKEAEQQIGKSQQERKLKQEQELKKDLEEVVNSCQPDTDIRDRRIFYEISGFRYFDTDFPEEDESDCDFGDGSQTLEKFISALGFQSQSDEGDDDSRRDPEAAEDPAYQQIERLSRDAKVNDSRSSDAFTDNLLSME